MGSLLALCCFAQAQDVCGQVVDFNIDTALKKYTFIKQDSSYLHNDSLALLPLYKKLYELQSTGKGRVNIAHIGDSHIQADNFSGNVRQHFHLDFGNAGRGLIFPYRLAKSNEPLDYKTTSPVKWDYKRNVFMDQPMPIGISGYTIRTTDTAASILLWLKGQRTLNYGANKLTIFHERGPNSFDLAVYDTLHHELGFVNMLSTSDTPYTSVLNFDSTYTKLIIRPCPKDSNQRSEQIYGMLLENGRPGVLYNMIGVNGAEFRHYNRSQFFAEQFSYLGSDLVIISLGTNEGFNYKAFNAAAFYVQIDSLVSSIQRNNPGVCILLTTPGDSFKRAGRKGRVKNPAIVEVRNTIIQYAKDKNLAWWDWFEACGGYGAMAKWYAAGMADRGRVHYSRKGYEIQGELFYKAMMKGYVRYVKSVTIDK